MRIRHGFAGTDFAWGVGVQAHITMFGARLEYENFNIPQNERRQDRIAIGLPQSQSVNDHLRAGQATSTAVFPKK
jgi:hypothetical protein